MLNCLLGILLVVSRSWFYPTQRFLDANDYLWNCSQSHLVRLHEQTERVSGGANADSVLQQPG